MEFSPVSRNMNDGTKRVGSAAGNEVGGKPGFVKGVNVYHFLCFGNKYFSYPKKIIIIIIKDGSFATKKTSVMGFGYYSEDFLYKF